jgi:hypothetical protein
MGGTLSKSIAQFRKQVIDNLVRGNDHMKLAVAHMRRSVGYRYYEGGEEAFHEFFHTPGASKPKVREHTVEELREVRRQIARAIELYREADQAIYNRIVELGAPR